MTSTYKISFNTLQHGGLKEIFTSLQRASIELGINFYLIGALARDVWFAEKGIRAIGTKDIDVAVMITDEHAFDVLKNFLVSKENFTTSSSNDYVLFDKEGHQIDILPFGKIEIEGKKIIDKKGIVHTDVTGFKEVFELSTEEVNFENEFKFRVSTLAGVVILKLIAYDDRPEIRSNDIGDIANIIKHYFDLETELIFEEHADLLIADHKPEFIGARVLGRQIKKILDKNELLKDRVLTILRSNTANPEQSKIGKVFVQGNIENVEEAIGVLTEIIKGIEE
ncbi:MAG TPA: hypothetical protein VK787_14110 [Puia sp.]|jgi:predicted nucleotidyltransferase|nr:hypothetical protein [Puia sp.]